VAVIQRSEDASRNLRSPWLGPTGAWRWPFDATYTEWAIGLLSVPVLFALLWLVVPVGGIVGLSAALFGRWAANGMALDHLARLTFSRPAAARRRGQVVIAGVAVLFGLVIVPNPAKWIFPSPFWAAGPLAVLVAFLLVRQARPFIDGNRPVTFWLRTLPEQWRGVAPLRTPLAVEVLPLVLDTEQADQVLLDFMASLNDYDPEDIMVIKYRERRPVVEAMLFDSTARDERLGQHVLVWLRDRGASVQVTRVQMKRVLHADGTGTEVLVRAAVTANGVPLEDGTVVVFNTETGSVFCVQRSEFGQAYEAMVSVAEEAAVRQGEIDDLA
jgi:hypothetical protein